MWMNIGFKKILVQKKFGQKKCCQIKLWFKEYGLKKFWVPKIILDPKELLVSKKVCGLLLSKSLQKYEQTVKNNTYKLFAQFQIPKPHTATAPVHNTFPVTHLFHPCQAPPLPRTTNFRPGETPPPTTPPLNTTIRPCIVDLVKITTRLR